MQYTSIYNSPIGEMLIAADNIGIVGIWFRNAKYFANCLENETESNETPIIQEAMRWLDIYFSGKKPNFEPPIHLIGTSFQIAVWEMLREIPYGATITYNEIAKRIAKRRNIDRMSAQAVGTAVGKNNISIIVPCHRVVGTNNSLAGYAAGIDKKIYLLKLEGGYKADFFVPKHSAAP